MFYGNRPLANSIILAVANYPVHIPYSHAPHTACSSQVLCPSHDHKAKLPVVTRLAKGVLAADFARFSAADVDRHAV